MAELESTSVETAESVDTAETETESEAYAKLKSEFAKIKAANDKLSRENAEKTKQLRAKQSAEEAAAEEAKALQQSMQEELETLRKEKAVAATAMKVASIVGDNEVATKVAQNLYGAENVEEALADIGKAWAAREKALRLEFGKIPAPGVGSSEGIAVTKSQLDAMGYKDRLAFATDHPDEYNQLMGRK